MRSTPTQSAWFFLEQRVDILWGVACLLLVGQRLQHRQERNQDDRPGVAGLSGPARVFREPGSWGHRLVCDEGCLVAADRLRLPGYPGRADGSRAGTQLGSRAPDRND